MMTNFLIAQSYRHLTRVRTAFCLAFAILVMASGIASKTVQANELYTVEDVEVDVTASNAVEAREKAFVEAQVKAYQILKERLLADDPNASVKELDAESISFLVQDFEVAKEQLTSKRYKGNYTIRFRPGAFQQKMAQEKVAFTDLPRGYVLILPFYQTFGNTILWDGTNPYMAAWARARDNADAIASTVVPIGDIDDVSQINEYSPLNYDPLKLDSMRMRYGANEALITMASPEVSNDGLETIKVSLYEAAPDGPKFAGQMTIAGEANEPTAVLYDRVVARIQQKLKSDWKEETAITGTDQGTIKAVMSFRTMREWIDAKRALETVPGVQALRVMKLSPREAQMELDFNGDVRRLDIALQRAGIFMTASADQSGPFYILQRAAFPPVRTPIYQ